MKKCCICETNKHAQEYQIHDGYRLLRCQKCSLIYLDSKVDPNKFIDHAKEEIGSQKKKIEYWGFPKMYTKYPFIFERFFAQRLKRCLSYNKSAGSMFDIGAGYGFWMDFCRQRGIEVKGIEISHEAADYGIKKFSLDIDKISLAETNFNKKYDLYNLCDVLEHLDSPNRDLQNIRNAMKPGSLLYVQVPDVLGFRIPRGHGLGLPHHLWQFNFRTLRFLLEKNGFKILKRWHGVQGIVGCYERGEVNIFLKLKWFFAQAFNLGNRLSVLCTV